MIFVINFDEINEQINKAGIGAWTWRSLSIHHPSMSVEKSISCNVSVSVTRSFSHFKVRKGYFFNRL